jgi:hypothetical protein
MSQRWTCQAPAVYWADSEALEEMVDADAAFHEVVRLVHDLWWRLPVAVRAVVASRLNGVFLSYSEGGLSEEYADGDLQLFLGKDGVSGAGRANVVRALLWGYGMAFLGALYVQTPGEALQLAAATGGPWDGRGGAINEGGVPVRVLREAGSGPAGHDLGDGTGAGTGMGL